MSGWGAIYHTTTMSLAAHSETLARLQEQVASGSRVILASDEPGDAYRIMSLRDQGMDLDTYQQNADAVMLNLEEASSSMSQVSSALIRARELMTQGTSDTYRPENRVAIAAEIDALLERCVYLANRSILGRFIFGGTATGDAPYTVERTNDQITAVRYDGSLQDIRVPIAQGAQAAGTVVGPEVFASSNRQAPEFLGTTGAAAGSGTSSARGDVWLTVAHVSTTYLGGSGVAAGSLSAAQDTILGNAHTLTVNANAGAGTVKLDGGTAVTFTGTETNLQVTNEQGQVAYIDVTGVGTFSGDVTINTTGELSIDDGDSTVVTDFTADNQAVTHADTGEVLFVDTTGIEHTGLEPVRVPGTYDVFGALITARDVLRNQREMSESQTRELMIASADSLSEAMADITNGLTTIGGQINAVDTMRDSLETVRSYADQERAKIQDADIVQVATELARTQTLYEVTLASAAKLLSVSLLDFIA